MSNIIKISQNFSSGVSNENEVNCAFAKADLERLNECKHIDAYIGKGSTAPLEYEKLLKQITIKDKLNILDIGVGNGGSSLYLGKLGHEVSCVEPSIEFCKLISKAAKKFSISLKIYNSTAEDLKLKFTKKFDVIFFNASLHHCDDPLLALNNAHKALKPGGFVFLSSETHLKPWQTEKSFKKLLEKYPLKMGHYGGNEHAYSSRKYVSMLKKANFINVKKTPSVYMLCALDKFAFVLNRKINGTRVLGNLSALIRLIYYIFLEVFCSNKLIFRLFASVSLVQVQYSANKSIKNNDKN